ncbi:MAG TPA: protein kinase [Chthoniobacterales bacterium]
MEGSRAAVCPACLLSAAITADPEDPVPHAFKNYDILTNDDGSFLELGRGAMGVTYKALDQNLHSPVAIKVIHAPLLDHPGIRERFVREARSAAKLQHPNVASVFHLETDGPTAFYVMEYVDGETLDGVIRRKGRLASQAALSIVAQITRALAAADKQHLVHRDIKPSNIMIKTDEDGGFMVKVIDFGLAKLRDAKLDLTHGQFVGTPQFASPEQFTGEAVDIRSDIYAVGLTFWHMLTGNPPIQAADQTLEATGGRPQRLPLDQLASFPRPIQRLLMKMLAPDPASRPQNPPQLLLEIKECQETLPSDPNTPWTSTVRARRSLRWQLSITAGVLAAAGLAAFFALHQPASTSAGPSLVVLPFENLSSDPDDAWFSNALTEEITTNLAQIPALRVVSRSSAQSYAGSNKRPPEIGRELGVRTVLEGSASRQGNSIRISTRLIDVATDRILAAMTYDREMKDIFEMQADLAAKISDALHTTLNPEQVASIERKPTESLTAYDYYLQGKTFYNRFRNEDNERAITLFKQAIQIDPNYALAYAGLATAYNNRAIWFGGNPAGLNQAETAARHALHLDPDLPAAHSALGAIHAHRRFYRKSIEEFKHAILLNPNQAEAMHNIGVALRESGRLDEALPWFKKAIALDPRIAAWRKNLGDLYLALNEPKKAEESYRLASDLQPEQVDAQLGLCRLHLLDGHPEVAKMEIDNLQKLHPDALYVRTLAAKIALFTGDYESAKQLYSQLVLSNRASYVFYYGAIRHLTALGFIELRAGNADSSEALLSEATLMDNAEIKQSAEYASPVYDLAAIQAIRGDKDAAFAMLDKAIATGWTDYRSLRMDPRFGSLSADPRFKKTISNLENQIESMRRKASIETTAQAN